jgi:hypothetical protein
LKVISKAFLGISGLFLLLLVLLLIGPSSHESEIGGLFYGQLFIVTFVPGLIMYLITHFRKEVSTTVPGSIGVVVALYFMIQP